MLTPLQITFRGTTRSSALDARLRDRVERLNQIFDGIVSCHVVVDLAGHHHDAAASYHVTIDAGLACMYRADDLPRDASSDLGPKRTADCGVRAGLRRSSLYGGTPARALR